MSDVRNNVWYDLKVSFTQAALGDKIQLPTLDGDVKFDLPAGTQPGEVFVMKGKGIQSVNGRGRGDQLVRIVVNIPKSLSENEKQLLMQLETSLKVKRAAPVGSGEKKSNLRDKFEKHRK